MVKRTTPESLVVNACLRWLWLKGCFVYRNNTGGWKVPNSNRVIRYGFPGSADIIGVTPSGRFIACECKAPNGYGLTDRQRHFQARIEENKGIYVVARSVDDLENKKELFT